MSDMKKVFVTLVDADGVEHRVAGYAHGGEAVNGVFNSDRTITATDEKYWYIEVGNDVKVEPAPKPLPTGLGAVVYLHRDGNAKDVTLVRYATSQAGDSIWSAKENGGVWYGVDIAKEPGPYEILSPGVEVNR